MVDVTISAGGEHIQAHRLVLCACSSLFAELLCHVNEEHSTIILTDIAPQDIRLIIEFSYNGKVGIPVENLNNLLQAAHYLKIYGLMDVDGLDEIETSDEKDFSVKESYILDAEFDKREAAVRALETEEGFTKIKNVYEIVSTMEDETRCTVCDEPLCNGENIKTVYSRCLKNFINKSQSREDEKFKQWIGRENVTFHEKCRKRYSALPSLSKKERDSLLNESKTVEVTEAEELNKADLEADCAILKTRLSSYKVRLIDEGETLSTFSKKRKTIGEEDRQLRIEKAVVNVYKKGFMSLSTAAATYEVSKGAIWRHFKKKSNSCSSSKKSPMKRNLNGNNAIVSTMEDETRCTVCDEPLCNGENIKTVYSRCLKNFINKSQSREDEKFKQWIGRENVTVHEKCRKRYSALPSTLSKRKRDSLLNDRQTVEVIEAEELNKADVKADCAV